MSIESFTAADSSKIVLEGTCEKCFEEEFAKKWEERPHWIGQYDNGEFYTEHCDERTAWLETVRGKTPCLLLSVSHDWGADSEVLCLCRKHLIELAHLIPEKTDGAQQLAR